MSKRRYDVYLWYGGSEGWHRHRAGVRKWTLVRVFRRLLKASWDSVSVLVERTEA